MKALLYLYKRAFLMRNRHFIFFLVFLTSYVKSQNLVPNGSFELHSGCPTAGGQINFATPWYNPNTLSPDYFNTCGSSGFDVPVNIWGYQFPRTGSAYSEIGVYGAVSSSSAREYIQVQLTDTLIAGKLYCVSFFVSQAGASSLVSSYTPIAISEIGLLFSNNSIIVGNYNPLPFTPQIISPSGVILDDTTSWTEISGIYTALGGERFITIGNFKNDISTDTLVIANPGFDPQGYYYVDDVSVIDCDSLSGIDDYEESNVLKVYPNPTNGLITVEFISNGNEDVDFEIVDVFGQVVYSERKKTSTGIQSIKFNVSDLPRGAYFIRSKTEKVNSTRRFVKK